MNKFHKLIFLFLIFIAAVLVIMCFLYRNSEKNEEFLQCADTFRSKDSKVLSDEKTLTGKKRINVLFLGIEGKARADTIIFASYDEESGKLSVISIPRDTYFHEAGFNRGDQRKINAVYGREKEEGCVDAVSRLLGNIGIDYYVSIDYEGVEKIIDTIKGVEIEVPLDMKVGGIMIEKGWQVLYGKEALQYLRFRKKYPDGDLGRIKAQQKLIKSALNKVQYSDMSLIVNRAFESVKTNMPFKYILNYARTYKDNKVKEAEMYTLPGTPMYKSIDGYNWSYYFQNLQEVKELMNNINGIESVEQRKRKRCE